MSQRRYGRYGRGRGRGRDFAGRALPKKKGNNHVPERWKDYLPVGQRMPGTRFIAFKVPLQKKFETKLMPDECFSPLDLFNKIHEQNEELGLIIDLTYTQRYYKAEALAVWPRLTSNSRFSCLSLPGSRITGVCHHTRLFKVPAEKRAPDPLEQELQAVVSHQAWVLRTE